METIGREGGVIVYLRGQEGRGIGLVAKVAAYARHNLGYLEFLSGDLPRALELMLEPDKSASDFERGVVGTDRAKVLLSAGLDGGPVGPRADRRRRAGGATASSTQSGAGHPGTVVDHPRLRGGCRRAADSGPAGGSA